MLKTASFPWVLSLQQHIICQRVEVNKGSELVILFFLILCLEKVRIKIWKLKIWNVEKNELPSLGFFVTIACNMTNGSLVWAII